MRTVPLPLSLSGMESIFGNSTSAASAETGKAKGSLSAAAAAMVKP
jgi:hypothetical protein